MHGHLVGSELLSRAGQRLQELSRPQDMCFRYGGDEFVVVMPETGRADAQDLAINIHRELTTTRFHMNGRAAGADRKCQRRAGDSTGRRVHHSHHHWRSRCADV